MCSLPLGCQSQRSRGYLLFSGVLDRVKKGAAAPVWREIHVPCVPTSLPPVGDGGDDAVTVGGAESVQRCLVELDHHAVGAHATAHRLRRDGGREVAFHLVDEAQYRRVDRETGFDSAGKTWRGR